MKKIKPAKPGSKRAMMLIRDDYIERLEERIYGLENALRVAQDERDEAKRWAGPERQSLIDQYEEAIRNLNSITGENAMVRYERDAALQDAADWKRRYWALKGIQP